MNAFEQLTLSVTARGAKAKKANNAPIRLEITDDDFPEKRSTIVSKYTSTFEKMKPGQRVKCPPDDVATVQNAMRKWLRNSKYAQTCVVRCMTRHPDDGMGGVWMLQKGKQ